MGKKGIAVFWLCLILASVLLTLQDRTLCPGESFLTTYEDAQKQDAEAKDAYGREHLEAQARTERGQWGKEVLPDKEIAYPWQGKKGVNLSWGRYRLSLSAEPGTTLSGCVFSPGRNRTIQGGSFSGTVGEDGILTVPFVLSDSALEVQAALSEGSAQGAVIYLPRSLDGAVWLVTCGAVLTWLFLLWQRDGERGNRARRRAVVMLFLMLLSCMPLLWQRIGPGHDLLFHLNRIEGIAAGMRAGQFPVRIHASTLEGYGYAASEFYPELFLYIPALLRNLGMSLYGAYVFFLMGINFAAIASMYSAAEAFLKTEEGAAGAALLYVLSPYRLVNLYTRATVGESLAMVFFPLLLLGMREVLAGDRRRWPILSLSMLGICMSHLLSTLFSVLFCLIAALVFLPRLWAEKGRILAIVKAGLLCIACGLWFLVPMLEYSRTDISTSVVLDTWLNTLTPGGLLVAFPGGTGPVAEAVEDFSYTVGVVPGIAVLLGVLALAGQWFAERKAESLQDRTCLVLLPFGLAALVVSIGLFPWRILGNISGGIGYVIKQIQFPWRLIGIGMPFLCICGAWGYLRKPEWKPAGLAVLTVLAVLPGLYLMQHQVETDTALNGQRVLNTQIDQFEYMYPYTEKEALEPGDLRVRGLYPYTIENYRKNGTNVSFDLEIEPGELYILEAPLLYYPGYEARCAQAERIEIDRGTNNVLRLRLFNLSGASHIEITYKEPILWRISEAVSLAAFFLLAGLCRRRHEA